MFRILYLRYQRFILGRQSTWKGNKRFNPVCSHSGIRGALARRSRHSRHNRFQITCTGFYGLRRCIFAVFCVCNGDGKRFRSDFAVRISRTNMNFVFRLRQTAFQTTFECQKGAFDPVDSCFGHSETKRRRGKSKLLEAKNRPTSQSQEKNVRSNIASENSCTMFVPRRRIHESTNDTIFDKT